MNSKPTIVVNKNIPYIVETFSRIGNVIPLDTSEVTTKTVRDADILIVRSETHVDRDLLEGSSVRFVGTLTIGTDHVDTDYLASKGISFSSAPGSNSTSVAEYVAAALLVWSRQTGNAFEGTTLGVVGVGSVGRKVVRVAKALGINVLLNDPPLARTTHEVSFQSLEELMSADIITLHAPLMKSGLDATYHLFDEKRINKMKQGAVLINTSRGAVVNSRALHSALSSGRLSTAILDVWENEPNIDLDLLNSVMIGTPHIAGYSLNGKLNALNIVYKDVCKFLDISVDMEATNLEHSFQQQVTIPSNLSKQTEVIEHAIKKAYDIELDNKQLCNIQNVSADKRGKYFSKLRAEYRTRREFYNWSVELSAEQVSAMSVLRSLGFPVKVKQSA